MHSLCQNGKSLCVHLMVYLPRWFALFLDPSATVSLMSLALVIWGLRWEHTRTWMPLANSLRAMKRHRASWLSLLAIESELK